MVAEPAYWISRCETARHGIGGNVAPRFLVKRAKQRALFQQFSAAIRRACIGHRLHLEEQMTARRFLPLQRRLGLLSYLPQLRPLGWRQGVRGRGAAQPNPAHSVTPRGYKLTCWSSPKIRFGRSHLAFLGQIAVFSGQAHERSLKVRLEVFDRDRAHLTQEA